MPSQCPITEQRAASGFSFGLEIYQRAHGVVLSLDLLSFGTGCQLGKTRIPAPAGSHTKDIDTSDERLKQNIWVKICPLYTGYQDMTQLFFTDVWTSSFFTIGKSPDFVSAWQCMAGYDVTLLPLGVASRGCPFVPRRLEQNLWWHIRWRRPSECACALLMPPSTGLEFLQDVSLVDGWA